MSTTAVATTLREPPAEALAALNADTLIPPAAQEATASSEAVETREVPDLGALDARVTRSLKAYGLTDEEIAEGLATNGEYFVKFADRVYKTRQEELKRESDFGRRVKTSNRTAPPEQAAPTKAASGVDLDKLREKYGDDPLIKDLVDPLRNTMAEVSQLRAELSASKKTAASESSADLNARIDKYFDSSDFNEFRDYYGDSRKTLTPEQFDRRMKVVQDADDRTAGRLHRGEKIEKDFRVEDMLQMSHDALSVDTQRQKAVQEVTDKVKKRATTLTQPPASRVKTVRPAASVSEVSRHINLKSRLQEMFGHS